MNLVGQKVVHTLPSGKAGRFGKGVIVESPQQKQGYILVKFDSEKGVKSFAYPECFGKYLKIEDARVAKQVKEIVDACNIAINKHNKQSGTGVAKEAEKKETLDSILAELDAMIGLESVKKEVRSLSSFIQINNLRRKLGLRTPVISKHLVFTGNPGTGKTTVARIISRIYYTIGATAKKKFVEAGRADLVAGYIGQTALKMRDVIDRARGGILFIDEAYALASDSKNDFGKEAIDTLISAMENERDNLIVIVAGYEEPMKKFMKMNPGLSSRFNRYIKFGDYQTEDLMAIFSMFCDENEYFLSADAEVRLDKYLHDIYEKRDEDFGNARTVRNIFEKIITCQAERLMSVKDVNNDMLVELTVEDIESAISFAA